MREVRSAVAHGLQPIALVSSPPDWAAAQGVYGRNYQPDPGELKSFAIAAGETLQRELPRTSAHPLLERVE